jgi:hypothetical protein
MSRPAMSRLAMCNAFASPQRFESKVPLAWPIPICDLRSVGCRQYRFEPPKGLVHGGTHELGL